MFVKYIIQINFTETIKILFVEQMCIFLKNLRKLKFQ